MKVNRRISNLIIPLALILILLLNAVAFSETKNTRTFSVMAPLHVQIYNNPAVLEASDWANFANELAIAKSMGVNAVSVDVWWGDVESKGDQQFDWSYYDKEFSYIITAGLRIVPIMSFHQCGGNINDNYTSKLPGWLWKNIKQNDKVEDMKFRSELGNYSDEYVSLWADSHVLKQYEEFMAAFANFCDSKEYTKYLDEINISSGPAGELRYPSYNSHDFCYGENGMLVPDGNRTGWPFRGALQCYGDLALKDFQAKMAAKYGSIKKIKAAWGSYAAGGSGKTAAWNNTIALPNNGADHGYPDKKVFKADQFFLSGDYYKTQYGRDLIEWYNQSLIDHGKRMLTTAKAAFGGVKFKDIPLGFKISGIHWQMGTLNPSDQPVAPRAAEIAAGLIRPSANFATTFDLNSEKDTNGHGYANILSLGIDSSRTINVHFTCLEMGNKKTDGAGDTPNQYSLASSLVGWVAAEAYHQGIIIKGENALNWGLQWINEDKVSSGNWVDDWDRMNLNMERYPFAGLTILRISDVTTAANPKSGISNGKNCYQQMINAYKSNPVTNAPVTIFFKGTDKTGTYTLKPIDAAGLAGSYSMTYDGQYNDGYWWKVTINAPNYFKFNVINNDGIHETLNRVYMRYPNNDEKATPLNTIYIKPNDPVVYSPPKTLNNLNENIDFGSLDQIEKDWLNNFNIDVEKIDKYYTAEALFLPETERCLQGSKNIVDYFKKNYHQYGKLKQIKTLGRYQQNNNCIYEIGFLENDRMETFVCLIIWEKSDGLWQKELECIAKKTIDKDFSSEINLAREKWVKLGKGYNPQEFIDSLYTDNAIFHNKTAAYNKQSKEIVAWFSFLSSINVKISPKLVICVKPDLAYEICEWSASDYKGNCMYLWNKQENGEWRIMLSSDY